MALGDLVGEIGNTYLAAERAAKAGAKPSLADGFNPASGPVGRATQQLTNLSQLAPPFTPPAQQAQASTPSLSDALPGYTASPPAQKSTPSLADALPGSTPAQVPSPAPQLSLSSAAPGGAQQTLPPQPARTPNLADAGSRIGAGLLGIAPAATQTPASLRDAAPIGVQPIPGSPTYPAASQQAQSLMDAAPKTATPAVPAQPTIPAQPATLSLEQARPVVGGADTSNANTSIVGSLAPDGTAQFSNARPDLASAFGQAPVATPIAPTAARAASLADAAPGAAPTLGSLGTASNIGDGVGVFSQANAGDAKLAMDRFQKAADLRQAYSEQDALAEARRRAGIDASVTVVGDSSKPLTRSDLAQAGLDQQARQNDQQAIQSARNDITTGQAQRAAALQARQAQNFEDVRAAAIAPNATQQQKAAYQALVDPDGSKALARQTQQAQISASNARAAKDQSVAEANGRKVKGLPATLQKLEDEDIGIIGSTKTMNSSLDKINSQMDDGTLQFGPLANMVSSTMNAVGASDQNSANFASFQATLEKLRNESLRLNKGTQTEGDAERAFNELFTNIKDQKIVKQRLKEIAEYNKQATQVKVALINNRRANQGLDPLDVDEVLARSGLSEPQPVNQQQGQAQPQQGQPQQQSAAKPPVYAISTPENFASLPHGAHFIDPQGNHRVKE